MSTVCQTAREAIALTGSQDPYVVLDEHDAFGFAYGGVIVVKAPLGQMVDRFSTREEADALAQHLNEGGDPGAPPPRRRVRKMRTLSPDRTRGTDARELARTRRQQRHLPTDGPLQDLPPRATLYNPYGWPVQS